MAAIGEWARKEIGVARWFEGFFDRGAPPRQLRVAAHRVTVTSDHAADRKPSWHYSELYDDGAGFACRRLFDPRRGWSGPQPGAWVWNLELLWNVARCLLLLGRHAGENSGAWGDALIEARVVSAELSRLAYVGAHNHADEIDGGRELTSPVVSRHTGVVEGLARPGGPLLATTRMLATDLFHSYGSPEVRQITPDGRLRWRHIDGGSDLRAWADSRGVVLTDETVE